MSKQEPVAVAGVMLHKDGDYTIVSVEIGGRWVEVIREHSEGPFSHIAEPLGIRQAAGQIDTRVKR